MAIARWVEIGVRGDERGLLVPIESGKSVPFDIKRAYYLYRTLPGVRRGLHAHRHLQQIAFAVSGVCSFLLDDGRWQENVRLDRPERGLLIEPMVWHEMYDFSEDCVLLVLASDHYDEADYIRSRADFDRLAQAD